MPKRKTSLRRPVDASKLSIWKAFVASGGRVAEVATQYGLTPAEVEKIVREVEDSFHAPLNDPKILLKQFSLLNEAAAEAEFILYDIIQHFYHTWKKSGEDPPPILAEAVYKWHSLLMERMKLHARLVKDMQRSLAAVQEDEEEKEMLRRFLGGDNEDGEEPVE
jgi:transposase-like protein